MANGSESVTAMLGNSITPDVETVSLYSGKSVSLRALYRAIEHTQPHKVIASCLEISASYLSRIFSGEKQLGWQRYDDLPQDTRKEFIRLLAEAEGLQVRSPSRRAEALMSVLMATAEAIREGEFADERLDDVPLRMAQATLDEPMKVETRRRA